MRFTIALALSLVATAVAQSPYPKVLVIGGANNHDHRFTTKSLKGMLEECGRFEVDMTTDPKSALEDPQNVALYSAFVLDYNGPRWGEPAETNFVNAVRKGKGVVVVHAANNAFPGWVEYEKMTGLGWRRGTGSSRFHGFDVDVVDHYHPITKGMPSMQLHPDEIDHHLMHLQDVPLRVLLSAYSDPSFGGSGRREPIAVVLEYGEGRVFHTTLGHVWTAVPQSRTSHSDPQFRRLICRGTEWAAIGRVTLSPLPLNWVSPDERKLGFRPLFNGYDMDQWRGYKRARLPSMGWYVGDGTIVHEAKGGGGDLITIDQFADFELRFEWKVEKGANSGVIYRVSESRSNSYETGPEYQILDDRAHGLTPDRTNGAGALYALQVMPQKKRLKPTGEFNTGRILVRGWHVQHWLNGAKVVDVDLASDDGKALIADSKFKTMPEFASQKRGHIVLQDHGDGVEYRNLRIREIRD